MESPLPRGFWETPGDGRIGLLEMAGPLSRLPIPGEAGPALDPPTDDKPESEELEESFGRVEANLLPVDLSLTLRGLKTKGPEELGPEELGGLGLGGWSCKFERGILEAFTPPIGGGGGGGGGAPV